MPLITGSVSVTVMIVNVTVGVTTGNFSVAVVTASIAVIVVTVVVSVAVITVNVTVAVTITVGGPHRVGDARAHRVGAVGRQRRRQGFAVARLSVPAVRA